MIGGVGLNTPAAASEAADQFAGQALAQLDERWGGGTNGHRRQALYTVPDLAHKPGGCWRGLFVSA